MAGETEGVTEIDRRVTQLFALVSEALAGATEALLGGDTQVGRKIVDADREVDALTDQVIARVWSEIESGRSSIAELRRLVNILLILPELERSADLAEHIAQRAMMNLGPSMSPASRGFVQGMSEVALEMWAEAASAYARRSSEGVQIDALDDEIDLLHDRLRREIAVGSMPTSVASEVTLISRFYERLGDHAVNLARRIGLDAAPSASEPAD